MPAGQALHTARRRQGLAGRHILIAAAAVAIIASIVITVYQWTGNSANSARDARAKRPMAFECLECSHRFRMAPPDFHAQWKDVTPTPQTRYKADCPECKGHFCSRIIMATVCDRCGHESEMTPEEFAAQHPELADETIKPDYPTDKAHCPKCKERFCCSITSGGRGVRRAPARGTDETRPVR